MKKNYILKLSFFFIDILLIMFSFVFAWKIRFNNESSLFELFPKLKLNNSIENILVLNESMAEFKNLLCVIIIVWVILTYILDLLHVPRTAERINNSFWKYIYYPQSILISFLFLWIIFFNYDNIPRLFLLLFLFFEISLLTLSKKIRSDIFRYLRISGYDLIGIGMISDNNNIDLINDWLNEKPKKGFYFKNYLLEKIYTDSESALFELVDVLKHGDYLLLDKNYLSKKQLVKITELSENKGIHIYHLMNDKEYDNLLNKTGEMIKFGKLFTIKSFRLNVKNPISIINKRIFDFIFSFLFILFIYWWVYLIVSLIIKIQSKGPVIFKQERVGVDGDIFTCYKFRTMHINVSNSKDITKVGDERIFSFGQFLRKVNIDEFPQFINVLKGDMSVVGPRPHMVSEDKMLAKKVSKYRMRRWVKPGITGYAAMKGYRGGTESLDLMQKRIDLDVEYIEKWSFLLDIHICIDTVLEIIFLRKKGH